MSINKTTLHKLAKQYAPQDKTVEIQVGDKNVEIKVKTALSLAELGAAAQEICDIQFAVDENGKEIYVPYLHDFAERFVIIQRCTDLDLMMLRKSDENTYAAVEPIWQFLISDVYAKISDVLITYSRTYWPLLAAASELIDERRKRLEPSPAKIWSSLDELVDQMKQSFGEMTEEDIDETREAIKKLTKLDEGKIVELMRS